MIATNEELALLEKWKRKLCLQEWRIKLLTHLHPEEMMVRNAAGCTEWSEAIKTARIEIINPACCGEQEEGLWRLLGRAEGFEGTIFVEEQDDE